MKKQIELHRDLMDAIQSERPYAGESGNTFLTLPVTAQLMHLDSSAPTPILTPYTNPPSPVTGPRLKRKARSGDDENNADSSSIGGDERAGMAVDAKYDTFPYVINNIDNNLQREGRLALQVATAIHTATSSFTQSASIYIDHPTCGVTAGTSLRIPPEQLILPGLPHQVVLEAPKPSPVQDEHGIPSPEADAPRKKRSYTRRNPATSTKRRKAVTEQDPIPAATSLSDASDATPTRPAKLPRISTISPNTAPDDDASAAAALLKLANALTPSSPTTPTTAPASAPLRRASHTPKIMAHLDSCAAPIPSDDAEEKAWLQQQEVLIETISPPPPDGRKFRCHLCMMTAARRYNIFTHLKTHMEGVRKRKYGCRECGKSFFRFYELERHWERKKHYGILGTN
ncbi:hypothetical protein HK101_002421 [Irineochytrium annulatum]|nr:hypothetical protein HK101_002421 [Irineochytrium annulatum]